MARRSRALAAGGKDDTPHTPGHPHMSVKSALLKRGYTILTQLDKQRDSWKLVKGMKTYYASPLPEDVIKFVVPAIRGVRHRIESDDRYQIVKNGATQNILVVHKDWKHYVSKGLVLAHTKIKATYKLQKYIAVGSYGFVWEATKLDPEAETGAKADANAETDAENKTTEQKVAIKIIIGDAQPSKTDLENQVILGMSRVGVPCYHTEQDLDNSWTVIVMGLGRKVENAEWDTELVVQALERIKTMHELGIHCVDLKPNNTIIYENQIRLIDFDSLCEDTDFDYNVSLVLRAYSHAWTPGVSWIKKYVTTNIYGKRFSSILLERKYPGVDTQLLIMCMIFLGNLSWFHSVEERVLEQFVGVPAQASAEQVSATQTQAPAIQTQVPATQTQAPAIQTQASEKKQGRPFKRQKVESVLS